MFDFPTLSLFFGYSVILAFLPGPDILYIFSQTISQDRKIAALSAIGISMGCCFHTLAAALGISMLIVKSAMAFTIVKMIGAAYLIFVGVKMILEKNTGELTRKNQAYKKKGVSVLREGFFINVLNPKVAVFFMAFLPQFVCFERESLFLQFIFLGGIFIALSFSVNFSLVFLFSKAKTIFLQGKGELFLKWQRRITGSLLIILGSRLVFYQQK